MNLSKLLLVVILVPYYCFSQLSFSDYQNIIIDPTLIPESPNSIFTTDIDGDSIPDIIVTSRYDDKVSWYKNYGNGNFSSQKIISTNADFCMGVYCVDIDSDGDNDVISASYGDDKISWYENDGNGNFISEYIIDYNVDGARTVFGTDIDGDGDIDVIVGSNLDSKITWYENDGNGNFGTENIIADNTLTILKLYADDIDGDGDNDIVAAQYSTNEVSWYENDGNGNFGVEQVISANNQKSSGVFIADLNGDGIKDVVSSSQDDNKIAWYENNGNGFSTEYIISLDAQGANSVNVGDIDGDGDNDVVSTSNVDDKIAWYENDGNGDFSTEKVITSALTFAEQILNNDLDGDGYDDLVTVFSGSKKLAWYKNDGSGDFGAHHIINADTDSITSAFATDLDGDTDIDLLCISTQNSFFSTTIDVIAWYKNDGNGNFTYEQVATFLFNDMTPRILYSDDLDQDGDNDVFCSNYIDDQIFWYENDGNGNFSPQQVLSNAGRAKRILSKDVDGDNDKDVIGIFNPDKLSWLENDGNGNFAIEHIIAYNTLASSMTLNDIDSDGDVDIVYATGDYGEIFWYSNNGDGSFSEAINIATNVYGVRSIKAIDMDNDGYIDIIAAFKTSDKVGWYKNDGNGNFDSQQIIATNCDGVNSILITDIDGDSDKDVISASPYDKKIAWHENMLHNKSINVIIEPFIDYNNDGLRQMNEPSFNHSQVLSEPSSKYYINTSDYHSIYLSDTGFHTLYLNTISNFWAPSDSFHRNIHVDSFNYNDTFQIGLIPQNQIFIQSDISGGWPRCNNNVDYIISIHNKGNTIDSGFITYTLDDSATFTSSIPAPLNINGQTLTYQYGQIYPSHTTQIELVVEMPSTIQTLEHELLVYVDTGQIVLADSMIFEEEVRCSYDPNDKQVFPNYGDAGYILGENDELEYLIRFQNTGNDTAFLVEIKDTLDTNLDLNTFRLIAYSHPVEIQIDGNTRIATFTFEDINLTDTVTNEPESHGFIKYAIKPIGTLSLNDSIQNTAAIYFDENPPIITNTTLNTIYDCSSLESIINSLSQFYCQGNDFTLDVSTEYITNAEWTWNGTQISQDISGFSYAMSTSGTNTVDFYMENDLCILDTSLSFEVYAPSTNNMTINSCDIYISPSGQIWTASGTYTDTIPNSIGCDSIIIIDLTIHNSTSNSTTETACDTYTSPSGQTWNTSNIYTDTIPNSNGCDSIITIDLTILNSSSSSITETTCDIYTSPSGQVWNTSNTYTDTIPNTNGCDSIITIDLTIHPATNGTITEESTTDYNSPSGDYTWTISGTYTDVIENSNGCDSVITVYLTILDNDTTSIHSLAEGIVKIYPNPASDAIYIELKDMTTDYQNMQVYLLDINGQQVATQKIKSENISINTENIADGTYFIQISDKNQILLNEKVVVVK